MKSLLVLIIAMFALFCGALFYVQGCTIVSDNAPDWWGHAQYVKYILLSGQLPPFMMGWQTYQPPLYYVIAALAGKTGAFFGLELSVAIRGFSNLCNFVFAYYGLRFMLLALRTWPMRLLCCAVFLSWPLWLALAGRVSNEILLYPLWAASFYYQLRWLRQERDRDLVITLGLCAVMLLVKVSAIVPLATVGCILLYHNYVSKRSLKTYITRKFILIGLCIIVAAAATFARPISYNWNQGRPVNLIISNIDQDPARHYIVTTNKPQYFLTIETYSLFHSPFAEIFNDKTGRQYFWNTYFKTLLFGIFYWPAPSLAIVLNVLVLLCMGYVLAGSAVFYREPGFRFMQISMAVLLLAQLVDRLLIMTVTTHDARMTFPFIMPFIALLGLITEKAGERDTRWMLPGCVLMMAFLLAACCFDAYYLAAL